MVLLKWGRNLMETYFACFILLEGHICKIDFCIVACSIGGQVHESGTITVAERRGLQPRVQAWRTYLRMEIVSVSSTTTPPVMSRLRLV